MLIDEINDGTDEYGISFSAAGRRIYQTAFFIDDVLPCLLLKQERLLPFGRQPLGDDIVSFGGMELQKKDLNER